MTPKRQRMVIVVASTCALIAGGLLIANAFRDNLVFFRTPTEMMADPANPHFVRVGGLVVAGSVQHGADNHVRFEVSDGQASLPVDYTGLLPDLFREGQGVVAEGQMESGQFRAKRVLAKHDENYMPPEVVEALKRSGRWKEGEMMGEKP